MLGGKVTKWVDGTRKLERGGNNKEEKISHDMMKKREKNFANYEKKKKRKNVKFAVG